MNRSIVLKVFVPALLFVTTHAVQAQHSWAMVSLDDSSNWPSIAEYHCLPEKGKNGIDYYRIYDEIFNILSGYSTPVKLHYGYRMSEKHIFIYDFEAGEERLAFDFTLSVGDHFKTYNGMEWEVEAAKDTLVTISFQKDEENSMKRLLKVCSVDGLYSDQWLEDFGSFANHFMILPMRETQQVHTLWMEYDMGHYLIRNISSDPLFTHDYGNPEDLPAPHGEPFVSSIYKDGTLTVEEERYHSPNREYICYYRVGNDLYNVHVWELNPMTGIEIVIWYKDIANYYGLPTPQSGQYIVHINRDDRPLGIQNISGGKGSSYRNYKSKSNGLYNLSGHRLSVSSAGSVPSVLPKGVYIKDGQKVLVK
ncbi:MAG: hypothetical protein IJK15_03780 [Bacteroidaceae bacterium]|nr:hypothetical protein [Bacteroidaceae bacterium]